MVEIVSQIFRLYAERLTLVTRIKALNPWVY